MRCFLALELDKEKIKEKYQEVITDLKRGRIKGNFVPLENIHLTYIFFGNLSQGEIEKIVHVLDNMEDVKKFPSYVKINSISAFNQRVIFFNVEEQKKIKKYRDTIYDRLRKEIKINENNKFHAHITIARVKYGFSLQLLNNMNQHLDPISINIKALCLYESIFLYNEGVKYKKIKCWG